MMDNSGCLSIFDSKPRIVGKLEMNIIPVCADGESELPDYMLPERPEDIIGQRLDFVVEISRAQNLPEDFCKDVFCEYTFFLGEEKFTTKTVPGKNSNPEFNFRKHHTVENCSEDFLLYLQNNSVSINSFSHTFSFVSRFLVSPI